MMGTRQKIATAEEWDVIFCREIYCYLKRSGAAKAIKRGMRRRRRHDKRWKSEADV